MPIVDHFLCHTSWLFYLLNPLRMHIRLGETRKNIFFLMVFFSNVLDRMRNFIKDYRTQTELTSASCPKNCCFGVESLASQSLQVLSTLPVTYCLLSGDSEIDTTSPLWPWNSDVFLPVSKSQWQLYKNEVSNLI